MKRFGFLVAGTALVAGFTAAAGAQSGGAQKPLLGTPVFLAQPGIVTANAISPTDKNADAISGFNVRFTTVIPMRTPWFSLVAGTQFQPNGLGGNKANAPGFYYGAIIPVALVGNMTQQWVSLSIDPLGVYAKGLGTSRVTSRTREYGHDFFLEGAFVLNVGSKMMTGMGPWSGLGVYFLIDQQVTHTTHRVGATETTDRWAPVLLYGLSLPIAPWGK